jgi:hypothetical protein
VCILAIYCFILLPAWERKHPSSQDS